MREINCHCVFLLFLLTLASYESHGTEPAKSKQSFHFGAGYSRIPDVKKSVFVNLDLRLSFKVVHSLRIGAIAQGAVLDEKESDPAFIIAGGGFVRAGGDRFFGEVSACRSLNEKAKRLISRFTFGTIRSFAEDWFFEPQIFIQSEYYKTNEINALAFRPGLQLGFVRRLK